MRALTYHGAHGVKVDTVPDPVIEASQAFRDRTPPPPNKLFFRKLYSASSRDVRVDRRQGAASGSHG